MRRIAILNKDYVPYLSWTTGQRQFVPLLFGAYCLYSPNQKHKFNQVIIEEPELGLHPEGINAFLLMTLDLLSRGYKVALSTNSIYVMEAIWALQLLKKNRAEVSNVCELFDLELNHETSKLAQTALDKTYRVYSLKRNGAVTDISHLDVASENKEEASWGELNSLPMKVADVVSKVTSRNRMSNNVRTRFK